MYRRILLSLGVCVSALAQLSSQPIVGNSPPTISPALRPVMRAPTTNAAMLALTGMTVTNGLFGIRDTTPSYPLDVTGDINITSGNYRVNGTPLSSGIGGSGAANYLPIFATGTTLTNSLIWQQSGGILNFQTQLANDYTALKVIPSGTGYLSLITCYTASDIANAGYATFSGGYNTTYPTITIAHAGTGVTPNFVVKIDTAILLYGDAASGNMGVGMATAPTSKLQVGGAIATPVAAGGTVTLTGMNSTYLVNVNSAIVTLPSAATTAGRQYTIKTVAPCTSATLITSSTAQLIGDLGVTNKVFGASNVVVRVQSDGANWWIVGN